MFDLIIRGGDVVTPEGVVRCDVAVAGETIAAIATPGTLSADSAKQLIDATGHILMPGGTDPHVHLHHSEMGAKGSTAVHSAREFA
jgi:dihydroorotase-like cyclic amidohydrolase